MGVMICIVVYRVCLVQRMSGLHVYVIWGVSRNLQHDRFFFCLFVLFFLHGHHQDCSHMSLAWIFWGFLGGFYICWGHRSKPKKKKSDTFRIKPLAPKVKPKAESRAVVLPHLPCLASQARAVPQPLQETSHPCGKYLNPNEFRVKAGNFPFTVSLLDLE